jgi:hypothetical protein
MKVKEYSLLRTPEPVTADKLARDLVDFLGPLARKVNAMASGAFSEADNATDTVPTAPAAPGDFVKKKTRAEVGTAGSKYVLDGWEYVGGAWRERRYLTGN